jgi:low affinity Fe/Cu permease
MNDSKENESSEPRSERDMPSSVSPHLGLFDRFASATGRVVSGAPFFAAAVFIVVAWLIEGAVRMAADGPKAFMAQTYQLQINTVTTVITFLLVALLQNTQARDNVAIQEKLNAIAQGLGEFMTKADSGRHDELSRDVEELRAAVGLEEIVGAADQDRD